MLGHTILRVVPLPLQVVTMKLRSGVLGFLLLVVVGNARAVIPETGMWWNPTEPGRGYYIDVQGDTLFFTAYAYEDGQPVFYAGSGTLQQRSGEVLGFGFPAFSALGYEPWHYVGIELFRFEDGACLTCRHVPAIGTSIGAVGLYFDTVSRIHTYFQLNDGSWTFRRLIRLNYNFPAIVTSETSSPPQLPDLRGDWVFVDAIDRSVPPWRFNFTRIAQSVSNINRDTPAPWQVTFFDDSRDARFVCRREIPGLDASRRNSGCQLFVGAEPVFWARIGEDLGLDRIQAGYGAVPTIGEAYRGPGIILGTRVE